MVCRLLVSSSLCDFILLVRLLLLEFVSPCPWILIDLRHCLRLNNINLFFVGCYCFQMEVQEWLKDLSRFVSLLVPLSLFQLPLYVTHTKDRVVYGPFEVIYEPIFYFLFLFLALFLLGMLLGEHNPLGILFPYNPFFPY